MAKATAEPFRGSFIMLVDSKTQKVDVEKLRREIGAWLAARPTPRAGGCRTIQGPGNVIVCEGTCTKPGFSCEPKRVAGGTYICACQKPVTQQPFKTKKAASRRAAR